MFFFRFFHPKIALEKITRSDSAPALIVFFFSLKMIRWIYRFAPSCYNLPLIYLRHTNFRLVARHHVLSDTINLKIEMRSDRFNRAIKVPEQQVQSNSEVFNCTTDYRSIPQSMRTPRYNFLQSLYSKTNCVIK